MSRVSLRAAGAALIVLAAASDARAQQSQPTQPTQPDSAVFARVRAIAGEGDAPRARMLVDSALAAAPIGSPAFAEALYWRATLAVGAAAAESDYRRLAAEHAASPRAADALVRLAQLELVRGRPQQAREHLTRLLAEHRDALAQARGHYWRARIELEAGDARLACDALGAALGAAPVEDAPADAELPRQVAALRARLPRCAPGAVAAGPGAPRRDSADASTPAASSTPAVRLPYTVQVAAYDRRGDAEAFARRLTGLGLDARVSGSVRPFRVRVGRYATRADAATALRELKQRRFDGFVTDAEPMEDQR